MKETEAKNQKMKREGIWVLLQETSMTIGCTSRHGNIVYLSECQCRLKMEPFFHQILFVIFFHVNKQPESQLYHHENQMTEINVYHLNESSYTEDKGNFVKMSSDFF